MSGLLLLLVSADAQLREPLLGSDSAKSTVLERDSEADSQDSTAHVTIQQSHEVTETRTGDNVTVATEEDRCHCFPWSRRGLLLMNPTLSFNIFQ